MQLRLTFKHLSGSKANEEDNIALPPEREILLGRASECHVRYNDTDDLVSLKHLKIIATGDCPVRYMVIDLGSANGTFVNHQMVFGAVLILPGGHVQLGAGGPEFEFRLSTQSYRGSQNKKQKPAWKGWFAGARRRSAPVFSD
jgi:pSer/pThr/pTyr-binding forkhead associated (FHA) protein